MNGKSPDRSLVILDVGHGNCAILRDSNGVVVVDTGPGCGLLEYLSENGIKRIDVLMLSHADKDHIGGAAQLLASKTVAIGRVCLNTDSAKNSAIWDDLVYETDRADNRKELRFDISLVHDASGQYDQGKVRVEVLAPSKYLAAKGAGSKDKQGRKLSNNSLSAVIRFVQDGKPLAVLPGDIDELGLDDMVSHGIDAKAPLLVYPHHGGKGSGNDAAFATKVCGMVAPATVVFSVARGREKHPLPAVVGFVRQHAPFVRIACTQLTDHCANKMPAALPAHLAPGYAHGKPSRSCCAGTVVVPLDAPDSLMPARKAHEQFIAAAAPTALCRK